MKIGVMCESLHLPLKQSIARAAEMGAEGIQVYTVEGELAPSNMNHRERADFLEYVHSQGLAVPALCGDLGGHGFGTSAGLEEKIVKTKRIIDLAHDWAAPFVTTHLGVIPGDRDHPRYRLQRESCLVLGEYAAEKGVALAIETGPESPEVLLSFLQDVNSPGVGVNYDPANLVMVLNEDPVKGVYTLRDHILHTHAKDGVHLNDCDPVEVYNAFAEGGIAGFDFGRYFNELPLGEGAVDWTAYLGALKEIGYSGFLTIEREVGADPVGDIRNAVSFLQNQLKSV